jgi:hypothetical protein
MTFKGRRFINCNTVRILVPVVQIPHYVHPHFGLSRTPQDARVDFRYRSIFIYDFLNRHLNTTRRSAAGRKKSSL